MSIKYPPIVLYCLTCSAKLSVHALEAQTRDGRIVCTKCRMGEAGRLLEPSLPRWEGWMDILALAALCGLAWVCEDISS